MDLDFYLAVNDSTENLNEFRDNTVHRLSIAT